MAAHFQPEALTFLRALKRHNDRDWFNERKLLYEQELKTPMLAVIAEVNESFAEWGPEFLRDPAKCFFRIYRDTRFSKDKRPYKDHIAAWWVRQGLEKTSGAGFYLEVGPERVVVGAGCYMPEREQLLAIRRHLETAHPEMRALLGAPALKKAGMTEFDGLTLTRPPRGFAADHPGIDLIMRKQWGVGAHLAPELALAPALVAETVHRFRLALPLVRLLNGPLTPAKKPLF